MTSPTPTRKKRVPWEKTSADGLMWRQVGKIVYFKFPQMKGSIAAQDLPLTITPKKS
jgi:hypothetical protein